MHLKRLNISFIVNINLIYKFFPKKSQCFLIDIFKLFIGPFQIDPQACHQSAGGRGPGQERCRRSRPRGRVNQNTQGSEACSEFLRRETP